VWTIEWLRKPGIAAPRDELAIPKPETAAIALRRVRLSRRLLRSDGNEAPQNLNNRPDVIE
jgi:hypothetical protein